MSELSSSTVGDEDAVTLLPGAPHSAEHNSGRPVSWAAVTIIVIGFVIGGVAFIPHPTWWAIWVGAGVAVVGFLFLAFTNAVNEDWY